VGTKNISILIIIILFISSNCVCSQNLKIDNKQIDRPLTEYGGPQLDFDYIYTIIENLSNIIKKYPKGREFGTSGEEYAGELIFNWMNEIGLTDVHKEKIVGNWTKKDSWDNTYNSIFDSDYYQDGWIEKLDLKKNFTRWYLTIKVYDEYGNLFESKNFSQNMCFPFLKEETGIDSHNVSEFNISIFDDFKIIGSDGIVLIENDWRDPYDWFISLANKLKKSNVKGFILMDCNDDTIFMMPSGTSSPLLPRFSKPGFSINGSSGKWIKKYLNNVRYSVKADFCSEWSWEKVDSYNIIGDIPGKSPKIAILSAFYDGWWNQATFDMAIGVGNILGIAKYLIDNNIQPELTIRFICWGGHEWYFRGAKNYLKTHNIKIYDSLDQKELLDDYEDILYFISPSNYGFNKTYPMSINVGNIRDESLMKWIQNIANKINYTERTGIEISGIFSVYGVETYNFYHGNRYPERYCNHAIEFDRWPYPGYHRDGLNHTKGDVFSNLNDELFRVDCELVAEVTLRLTVEKLNIILKKPVNHSFYLRNLRLFNLPRNTIIYGPIDITADIESDVGIDTVEFYVDYKLKKIDTTEPYTYRWNSLISFKHIIKVVVYDLNGNYVDDEIQVWKWRIHPILISYFLSIYRL
jgi:hypothetical protein